MDDIVRILFIEDSEADVELARRELDRDGGRTALIVIRQLYPSTPCLFVSETTGEDVAITSLNDGFVATPRRNSTTRQFRQRIGASNEVN
jgi:hypothetical protein